MLIPDGRCELECAVDVWEGWQSSGCYEVKEIMVHEVKMTTDLLLIERNQHEGGLENVLNFTLCSSNS